MILPLPKYIKTMACKTQTHIVLAEWPEKLWGALFSTSSALLPGGSRANLVNTVVWLMVARFAQAGTGTGSFWTLFRRMNARLH